MIVVVVAACEQIDLWKSKNSSSGRQEWHLMWRKIVDAKQQTSSSLSFRRKQTRRYRPVESSNSTNEKRDDWCYRAGCAFFTWSRLSLPSCRVDLSFVSYLSPSPCLPSSNAPKRRESNVHSDCYSNSVAQVNCSCPESTGGFMETYFRKLLYLRLE